MISTLYHSRRLLRLLAGSAFLLNAQAAIAQESAPPPEVAAQPGQPANPRLKTADQPPPPPPGLTFRFEADAVHSFDAGLDGVSGSFDRTRVGGRLSVSAPVSEQWILGASAGGGVSIYDFQGQTGLLPGDEDPWGTIQTMSLAGNVIYLVDRQWTVFGGLNVASAGEDGAEFSDTLTVGGTVVASHAFSKELSIGLGITAQTQLEDDIFILPFPTVDWVLPGDPQGRWRLAVGGTRIGPSRAAGAALSFAVSEEFLLSAGVGAFGLGGDFRLSDTGPVPGGVGRDSSYPIVLGAEWHPSPAVSINAYAGIAMFGEIELDDASGRNISSRDVDPTPVLGVGITLSF